MIERFQHLGLGKRIVLVVIVVALGYNLVLGALGTVVGGSDPGGPRSSSYATGDDGLAAFADLLTDQDHPVTKLRRPLSEAGLDPGSTLVVADPGQLEPDDAEAAVRFVAQGGRLVAVGRSASPLVSGLAGGPLSWEADGVERSAPLAPVPVTEGVESVVGSGRGSYSDAGSALPVLGADGTVVAVSVVVEGGGQVFGIADSSILQNDHLADAGNAALALGLVGGSGRPVLFAETVHGYGQAAGLDALPSNWKWTAAGLALALLVAMWAYGQRFGPPEKEERELAPARRQYVDALAGDLARADHDPRTVAPLIADVRRRLAERTDHSTEDGDDALREAAVAAGLAPPDVDAALSDPARPDEVVAMAAAATRLRGGDR